MTSKSTPPPVAHARRHSTAQLDEELMSSAEELIRGCPRFRILVIGKSGAGKSALINAAFDVDIANVSHSQAGKSDIHQEITSEKNPRFILHDSLGFAAGETANFKIVENFIRAKSNQEQLRDRLHAIWFCVEVPTENGPLLEAGDRRFLNLPLGDVPVIVVFTKYDLLVSKLQREADLDDVEDEEAFQYTIEKQAAEFFENACVEPLRRACRHRSPPIPYLKVSTKGRYADTLVELVSITQQHIDSSLWVIWAVAQRANADLKIAASIEVGKRKYWGSLATSSIFPGKTLKRCLAAIHRDIVLLWNFNDPLLLLESPEFQALMSHLVSDLVDEADRNGMRKIISVTGVAGVISAAVPPATVIVVPLAAGLVFAQWVYMVYSEAPGVLRALMGYIVDLTIVMQSLFWIVQSRGGVKELRPRLIQLAVRAYRESGDRTRVHQDIKTYATASAPYHKDRTLEKVISLIIENRFEPPEIYKQHADATPVLDDTYEWVYEPEDFELAGVRHEDHSSAEHKPFLHQPSS